MKKIFLFFLFQFIFLDKSFAQNLPKVQVGLQVNLGTHVQRLGWNTQFYFTQKHIQIHAGFNTYFTFKNIGAPLKYFETQTLLGFHYAWGKDRRFENVNFHYSKNLTDYRNYLGFTHAMYFNEIGTLQGTGSIIMGGEYWKIVCENDMLGGKNASDEFRTGAISISYNDSLNEIGSSFIAWTGKKGQRLKGTPFPSRNGYFDMSRSPFALNSLGVLNLFFKRNINSQNFISSQIGIDSEKIRNYLQNKVLHDLYFLPARFSNKYNAHIPMVTDKNDWFMYQEGQKVRKDKLYFQIGFNNSMFY